MFDLGLCCARVIRAYIPEDGRELVIGSLLHFHGEHALRCVRADGDVTVMPFVLETGTPLNEVRVSVVPCWRQALHAGVS